MTAKPALLGARLGLLAGLACIFYLLALHFIAANLLLTPWLIFVFVIIIIFKIAAAYLLWREKGGQVPFKDALQSVFMVSVISLFMVILFFYLFFNFIDHTLMEQIRKNIADRVMKSFQDGHITKEQLDTGLARIQQINFGIAAASVTYSVLLFIGFFYALVFAAITRLIGKEISSRAVVHNN
jgi:hypothetical protein